MAAALDPAVKETLREAFDVIDKSNTGSLGVKEIGNLLNKMLGRNVDEVTLGEIISEICDTDTTTSGVNFDSFCSAIGPLLSLGEDEIAKRAFSAMDKDVSGSIETRELCPLMSAVAGTKLLKEQADDILGFSAGADGKVSLADFKRVTKA
jgi:Ca2+-binding EF-hand superfamily protein